MSFNGENQSFSNQIQRGNNWFWSSISSIHADTPSFPHRTAAPFSFSSTNPFPTPKDVFQLD